MARFYGWGHSVMMEMEAPLFNQYYECIDIVRSRERLISHTTADWPNIKKKSRSEIDKELRKRAFPTSKREKLTFSAEKLKELISGK